MRSTRERLERLFEPSARRRSRKDDEPLRRLEREMLGAASGPEDSNLSLKQRLERLVSVASERRLSRTPPREPPPMHRAVPLEEALEGGGEVENELGAFYCRQRRYPLTHRHGSIELGRIPEVPPHAFSILARGTDEAEIDLGRALFLDAETTGLAGGSGTYAFLIGLGFVEEGAFVLRQLFMRDYREEAAMLLELGETASRHDVLVSYNGKSFDLPLLETRLVLNRQRISFEDKLHFDLLHPSRSLWKARFESCRLSELESLLLGIERERDVPGHLIPEIYFRFVRTGDASRLGFVFEHNANDILSLATLTVTASDMLDEERLPENPIDDFSLGRLFERVEEHDRSELHYRRAVESGLTGSARRRSLRGLAELHKRRGEHDRARALWEELASEEGLEAVIALHELAMQLEHRERDFASALALCNTALERLDRAFDLPLGFRERFREAFTHRRRRLSRRSEGASRRQTANARSRGAAPIDAQ